LRAEIAGMEIRDDPSSDELDTDATAYPQDAWWHGEGNARWKWVKHLHALARCHELVEEEEHAALDRGGRRFDWLVILRPDVLHVAAVPSPSRLPQGFVVLLPAAAQLLTPQTGYIEGMDRAIMIPRDLAHLLMLQPLEALRSTAFVLGHPHCLRCGGWRAPGAKLSPEKHLANVLLEAVANKHPSLQLMVDPAWPEPPVLSAAGCFPARPGSSSGSSRSRSKSNSSDHACSELGLPRWVRELIAEHSCWDTPLDVAMPSIRKEVDAWVENDSHSGAACNQALLPQVREATAALGLAGKNWRSQAS